MLLPHAEDGGNACPGRSCCTSCKGHSSPGGSRWPRRLPCHSGFIFQGSYSQSSAPSTFTPSFCSGIAVLPGELQRASGSVRLPRTFTQSLPGSSGAAQGEQASSSSPARQVSDAPSAQPGRPVILLQHGQCKWGNSSNGCAKGLGAAGCPAAGFEPGCAWEGSTAPKGAQQSPTCREWGSRSLCPGSGELLPEPWSHIPHSSQSGTWGWGVGQEALWGHGNLVQEGMNE